jgi:SSS family solute:Na+ symporter
VIGRRPADESLAAGFLAWFLGCLAVYSVLFATGYLLYGQTAIGLVCLAVAIAAALWLWRTIPKVSI